MTYRDDEAALRDLRDGLARELAGLDRDLAELEERRAPVPLERLRIASPCKERWADMDGDDQARFCVRCAKQVFNLSAMTRADAESLLARHQVPPCVRLFRRADGTVMTSDCDRLSEQTRARIRFGVGAVTAGAIVVAAALAAQPRAESVGPYDDYDTEIAELSGGSEW